MSSNRPLYRSTTAKLSSTQRPPREHLAPAREPDFDMDASQRSLSHHDHQLQYESPFPAASKHSFLSGASSRKKPTTSTPSKFNETVV